jgi:spermidine synthase
MPTSRSKTLVLWFFFLSGVSGLIYEVVWARLLERVMGASVYSITTVLTVFMAGLALGSFIAGKIIDRRSDPLRIYGVLEGLIGVFCLLVPVIVAATIPIYRAAYQGFEATFHTFSLIRFLISGIVLLIPTTLMGATLPVLSKYFTTRYDNLGMTVGRLYAVNTFGAVIGSFAAGFVLMPSFGIMGTVFIAAGINIVVSALVFARYRREKAEAGGGRAPKVGKRDVKRPGMSDRERRGRSDSERRRGREGNVEPAQRESRNWVPTLVLVALACSGFAALVYQVAWMRTLSLIIGSSVYAMSLILTAYILGLAIGTTVFSRFVDRSRHLLSAFGTLQVGIGAAAILVVPVLGKLPVWMVAVVDSNKGSFATLMFVEFAIVFLIVLIPTVLMGGIFPTAIRLCTRRVESIGRSVGNVYAANTVGNILGAFAGGFLLIPWLGIQRTIAVAVVVNLVLGITILLSGTSPTRARKFVTAGVAALLLVAVVPAVPSWDPVIMSSGAYLYADTYMKEARSWDVSREDAIRLFGTVLYHKEGVATTVTVRQARSEIYLQSNGKTEASTGPDMRTQKLLAHAPMMLHQDPRDVLVIGLASGVTVGAALSYPVESIDCVEIAPAMIEVAETFFAEANGHCMDDPRLRMVIEDGRNHVAFTARRYDVMISQPSNPWIAGISNLFTREFFALARDRMNPGGVVGMWFQAYNMSPDEFRMIVRTFSEVFADASVWELDPGVDYMLVGTVGEMELDYKLLTERLADQSIGADLRSVGIRTPLDYTGLFLMGSGAMRSYAGDVPIHTDNGLQLEFSAPKNMYRQSKAEQLIGLDSYRSNPGIILTGLPEGGEGERVAEAVESRALCRRFLGRGMVAEEMGRLEEALNAYSDATNASPGEPEAMEALSRLLCHLGSALNRERHPEEALRYFEAAVKEAPDLPQPKCLLGTEYVKRGRIADAEAEFSRVLELDPNYAEAHLNMAMIHETRGEAGAQLAALERYLANAPAASNVREVRERIERLKQQVTPGLPVRPPQTPE